MYELKTELLQICEAFNLGAYKGSQTIETGLKGFILTEFTTATGVYKHYFRIKL